MAVVEEQPLADVRFFSSSIESAGPGAVLDTITLCLTRPGKETARHGTAVCHGGRQDTLRAAFLRFE